MEATKTLVTVQIRKKWSDRLKFLEKVEAFERSDITTEVADSEGYMQIDYYYTKHFTWRNKRTIKKEIRSHNGILVSFAPLHELPPIISSKMRSALISSGFIFFTTYLSGLVGLPYASSNIGVDMGIQDSSLLALISASIASATRLANALNISLKND